MKRVAFGDAGYRGVHRRPEAMGPAWRIAMRPGLRCELNPFIAPEFFAKQIERAKASVWAKIVEHPFRVIKRQFGYKKVRYRELKKNTAQVVAKFARGNLWMARRRLMGAAG